MKILQAFILATAATLCFSVAAMADEGKDESGKGYPSKEEHMKKKYEGPEKEHREYGHKRGDNDYFQSHGYTRLDIPKGHYPPPGECRIWYPDRPAGQQPPPGDCGRLIRRVPPGAWLIEHPEDKSDVVYVNAYDEYQPGVIQAVGEFNIGSGAFIKIVVDR